MRDGEQTLSERLDRGERISAGIELQLKAGEELLSRLTRIAGAGQTADEPIAAPDARTVAAAAQAFAERTRTRLSGQSGGLAA